MRKRVIALASLAIASMGVSFGATFALFTSNSETNIVASAAGISVSAELSLVSAHSKDVNLSVVDGSSTTFVNGNELALNGGTLLASLAPGDGFTLSVAGHNSSNINIRYRGYMTLASGSNSLAQYLRITHADFTTKWTYLAKGVASFDAVGGSISVEFPEEYESSVADWSSKSLSLRIGYEAVQGNAYVEDGFSVAGNASIESPYAFALHEPVSGIRAYGHAAQAGDHVSLTVAEGGDELFVGANGYDVDILGAMPGSDIEVVVPYGTGLSKPVVTYQGSDIDPNDVTYDTTKGEVTFTVNA